MNLQANVALSGGFKSPTQVARIVSEDWCRRELYCPACAAVQLTQCGPNTRACDFTCANCGERFELKSGKCWNRSKIVDAGYEAMIRSVREDRTPNLVLLQYSPAWAVTNLLVIPRHFISESAVEKRHPLRAPARRAGWIGCNILLSRIPTEGRIKIVESGVEIPRDEVRAQYGRSRKLLKLKPTTRGWTLDVLSLVGRIGKRRFALAELYEYTEELHQLHPNNRNIRAKIRQQLQILRDTQFLRFQGRGLYEVR